MKKKFYINQVQLPESDWNHRHIGLFDSNAREEVGHFCGGCGGELYKNTTLLAYGTQNITGNKPYNAMHPFDGGIVKDVNHHYDKIGIGSGYWEICFEANNEEEAVEIFAKQCWDNHLSKK